MTALRHDQAILDEQEQANVRVVSESTRPGERPYLRPSDTERAAEARAVCGHPRLLVFRSISTSFDDHETAYGYCGQCDAFLVATTFTNGNTISRPMTEAELEAYARQEEQRQRGEWLEDAQAGVR